MRPGLHTRTTCLPRHLPCLFVDVYTLWPFSRGRSCQGAVLSCGQVPLRFPAAEKVALALPHKRRFFLLQGTWRCSRCGVSLYLQIGVLGLDISFLRRSECGLRLGAASARTLRSKWISRFLPVKAAFWRPSAVISWPCCSWRIVTDRVSVRACIRGMLCTFLSFSQQTLDQLLCPFDTAHLGIAQLVAAKVIPLAVLGRVPQLAPQALCAVIQPSADQLFRRGLDPLFQSVLYLGLFFDLIDVSHLDPAGRGLGPSLVLLRGQVRGLGGHQFIELRMTGEIVHEGHNGAAALDESPPKVHIGDVGELVVGDVQQPG